MLALSVSISTSSSPRLTSSPSDFSHFRIVPSSIESDRRGIATSAMPVSVSGRRRIAASTRGQAGDLEPEAVDRLDQAREVVEIERLHDVAVDAAVVGRRHVAGRGRRREHDHRRRPQLGVAADLLEHLEPVLLREVEVEQDEVGPRRARVLALVAQERERLLAVRHRRQLDGHVGLAQRLARQAHVAGVVLDQQDRVGAHASSLAAGSVKLNRLPPSGRDSAQIVPPWRSTTFFAIARPMPVPGYSSRVCRRWNMRKMRSACAGSIPMPLSDTANVHSSPARTAATSTLGVRSSGTNLIALPIRFWKSWKSWLRSPCTAGRSPIVTCASRAPSTVWMASTTRSTTAWLSTGSSGWSPRPAREYVSRSSIRSRMRPAPSTAKSM